VIVPTDVAALQVVTMPGCSNFPDGVGWVSAYFECTQEGEVKQTLYMTR
jgi:hypothetical protein